MRNELRGKAALRHPIHIFVGRTPKRFSIDRYFGFGDALPPTPPRFLRDIGVNWLKDAAVSYGCLVISRRNRRPIRQLVHDALRDWAGRAYDKRAIRWISLLGGRSYKIVAFVQSDAVIRHRSKSTLKLVALAKNMRLFDAEELVTGSYCLTTSG